MIWPLIVGPEDRGFTDPGWYYECPVTGNLFGPYETHEEAEMIHGDDGQLA